MVPVVAAVDPCGEWALLSWIEGENFREYLRSGIDAPPLEEMVREYGKVLQWIHGFSVWDGSGPRDRLERKLAEVDRNIAMGWVDRNNPCPHEILLSEIVPAIVF